MYAFEVDEEKNELLAEVDEYGPASRYIAKDRDEAEKLIKEVKRKRLTQRSLHQMQEDIS